MLTLFTISLIIMLGAVAALALGRLLGGPGIRGGCGSLAGVDGGGRCAVCTRPCRRRRTDD